MDVMNNIELCKINYRHCLKMLYDVSESYGPKGISQLISRFAHFYVFIAVGQML